jgi:hypothetical protein
MPNQREPDDLERLVNLTKNLEFFKKLDENQKNIDQNVHQRLV